MNDRAGSVSFEYAVLRVVPRVERGETINAGVLLYCRERDFLGARVFLDPARLAALDPDADPGAIRVALGAVVTTCAGGDAEAARRAGPAGAEDRGRRFRRLTAPRSTVVQPGPVHTGLTTDPASTLDHLVTTLVLPRRSPGTVDSGGVRVWSSAAWRERAVAWLDERLAEAGIERTGPVQQPRVRPWATLLSAPTSTGRVWLKATAPRTAFEVGLSTLLHRVAPEQVLAPLAADPDRGWLLLPDGGSVLDAQLGGAERVEAMLRILPRYARMQRALAPHAEELLRLGVADMRPAQLPHRFEQALELVGQYVGERGTAADATTLARLTSLRSAVTTWSARLAERPGPASLDHNDLHPRNVLLDAAGRARLFDWGDAVLAHPFASLLVPLDLLGPSVGEPGRRRMREAYLAEFPDLGTPSELAETLQLACRLGRITRALVWHRAVHASPDGPAHLDPGWLRGPLDWLSTLLDAD